MSQSSGSNAGKTRVAVLFGGQSEEHDVSLRSAQTVMEALQTSGYEVVPVGITRTGRWISTGDPMRQLAASSPFFVLEDGHPEVEEESSMGHSLVVEDPIAFATAADVVFPVLHGPMGEDGTVQGLLELGGIPYVGSGVLGSAVAMDKAMTKTVLTHHGMPQADWILVTRQQWEMDQKRVATEIGKRLGFPCFTKPANMGSSVGVVKVSAPDGLVAAIDEAARHDRRIVVEKGIDARELEVSVLGNSDPVASVVGEIVSAHEFYDYESKYVDEGSSLIIPADLPEEISERARSLAVESFIALDLAGLARADFLLDRTSGELYLNEINTLPGFTSISMYPKLWEASGLDLANLVDRLVGLALERFDEDRVAGTS